FEVKGNECRHSAPDRSRHVLTAKTGFRSRNLAGATGLELAASCVTGRLPSNRESAIHLSESIAYAQQPLARKVPRCPQKPRKTRSLVSARGTFTAHGCGASGTASVVD